MGARFRGLVIHMRTIEREIQKTGKSGARGRVVTIALGDIGAGGADDLAADTIEIGGSLEEWAQADSAALSTAIAHFNASSELSLRLPLTAAHEDPVPAQALDNIAALQNSIGDRAVIDLDLLPTDTLYGMSAAEKDRAALLQSITATLREKPARVRWLAPLCHDLVYRLETFALEAARLGAELQISAIETEGFSRNDMLFAADFVRYRILEEGGAPFAEADRAFYQNLLAALDENALAQFVDRTPAGESGRGNAAGANDNSFLTTLKEAAGVLTDGARAHLHRFRIGNPRRDPAVAQTPINAALLIGAYGGEHIGDAAILGGVLFRLHNRHGLKEAVLMSQRPDHTRHLLEMIRTPVKVTVKEYLFSEIDASIDHVDAVVFAGGPFIDLPKQLVRHLYAATLAKLRNMPFIMEGVGPGPFPRLASKVTARRIISLADVIAVRTRDNANAAIIEGMDFSIGRDPAFDYLETRNKAELEIGAEECGQLDRLLQGAEGRPVIGINLRPIYHHYTVGVKNADKANYTSMVEDRFEQRMGAALTNFSRNAARKPIYILFPMNAVQFGLSDLKSAWRLGQHLGDDVDYRVWEADASLDAVVALLRRSDAAITMRFHATIFALSQGVDAIGVDYRIGKRDKVAAVLSDAGKGDQCARIDELTTEWLEGQLARSINAQDSERGANVAASADVAASKS